MSKGLAFAKLKADLRAFCKEGGAKNKGLKFFCLQCLADHSAGCCLHLPIFGLVPAIYLFIKRKDEQLEKMQGWNYSGLDLADRALAPNDHFLNLLCSSCWLSWQVKINKLKPLAL